MSVRTQPVWKPAGPAPPLDKASKVADDRLSKVLSVGNKYFVNKAASTGALVSAGSSTRRMCLPKEAYLKSALSSTTILWPTTCRRTQSVGRWCRDGRARRSDRRGVQR